MHSIITIQYTYSSTRGLAQLCLGSQFNFSEPKNFSQTVLLQENGLYYSLEVLIIFTTTAKGHCGHRY